MSPLDTLVPHSSLTYTSMQLTLFAFIALLCSSVIAAPPQGRDDLAALKGC